MSFSPTSELPTGLIEQADRGREVAVKMTKLRAGCGSTLLEFQPKMQTDP